MRKKLAVILIFCASLFVEVSAEMLIKQDLSVSTEVEATKYTSFVNINGNEMLRKLKTLSPADKNAIIKTYNNINDFLGKDSFCKGGSFEINPIYEYKNGKRIQNGFESHYSLNCEFSEIQKEDYNNILRKIESEVSKNQYLLFALPSINKVLDDKLFAEIDEQLSIQLLEFALQKAKEYSNISRQKCSIKEIDLNAVAQDKVMPILMKSSLSSTKKEVQDLADISLPTAKKTERAARGNVIFSCR